MLEIPNFLKRYEDYFMDKIPLNKSAKTIQIYLVRETHDYTIFRTEETRELNIVSLPSSITDSQPKIRVVMFASKQKAPENRMYIQILRTFAKDFSLLDEEDARYTCSLKDNLCRSCPRCVLFGAVSTEAGGGKGLRWNIKHRIEYSSAYSLEDYEDISEIITFNAVDTPTQSTGQALGATENIMPVVHFPSIVTLNSVTWKEFIAVLKTIMATKSYGAETRIKGDVINHIVGISFGYEEIMTSLEFMLELANCNWKESLNGCIKNILEPYKKDSTFPNKVTLVYGEQLSELLKEIKNYTFKKEFIKEIYEDASNFSQAVRKEAGGEKK